MRGSSTSVSTFGLMLACCGLVSLGSGTLVSAATSAKRRVPTTSDGGENEVLRATASVRDKYVEVNGLRLHYRDWGRPDAPPVLMLHGLTGHAWEFDRLASALADEFHVLVLNQRGHGASGWAPDYSPAIMADDVASFIEARDLDRVRVIGHSMGGVNGWWLAARHPERVARLVILDIEPEAITSEKLYTGWRAAMDAYARARYASRDEAAAAYLDGYTGAHADSLRTFALNNVEAGPDGHWTWRFDARGLGSWLRQAMDDGEEHWARLREVACPTLVIRAAQSPYTTLAAAERMARTLRQARLVEMPDSGHDIHFDQLDALLGELRPFLRGE